MSAEAEGIGWFDDRLGTPWGGLKGQGCAGSYTQESPRWLSMPASPLGETRALAPIVRILVARRDREFLKTPGSRKALLYST